MMRRDIAVGLHVGEKLVWLPIQEPACSRARKLHFNVLSTCCCSGHAVATKNRFAPLTTMFETRQSPRVHLKHHQLTPSRSTICSEGQSCLFAVHALKTNNPVWFLLEDRFECHLPLCVQRASVWKSSQGGLRDARICLLLADGTTLTPPQPGTAPLPYTSFARFAPVQPVAPCRP